MTLKRNQKNKPWYEWKREFRDKENKATIKYRSKHEAEILYYIAEQFFFFKQWNKLKKYANKKGIYMFGDMPFYVSYDSCECFNNRDEFLLDSEGKPIKVAGCPPDSFSSTGQLWGNPIYNWSKMKSDDYSWWIKRLEAMNLNFDITRIDHFRGFDAFYTIDYGKVDARDGVWEKGPGIEFFNILKESLPELDLVCEDLGFITDSVRKLISDTGYPGMRILQFGFDDDDYKKNIYYPENYSKNSVAYVGTHDNDTAIGFVKNASEKTLKHLKENYNIDLNPSIELIKATLMSPSFLAVLQMQDILGLDSKARMNIPSTISDENWVWRMKKDAINDDVKENMRYLLKTSNRL